MAYVKARFKLFWHCLTNFHRGYAETWHDWITDETGESIGCFECKKKFWGTKYKPKGGE